MKILGVYYSDLIPVLIKSIQDQQKEINELKSMLESLSKRIEKLEK